MKEELNLLKNQKQLNFKPFLKIGNIYSCLKIFSLILLIFSNPPPVHFLLKKYQKKIVITVKFLKCILLCKMHIFLFL